jgi:corrinoid protein of di/trimethylamine methyltransferase
MNQFDPIKGPMVQAVKDGDAEASAQLAHQALEAGVTPAEIFNECIIPTLRDVGDRFARLEIFLPEMMLSAEAAKAVIDLIEPALKAQKAQATTLGKVVIGTVNGDIHDIGKNMVATMLEVSGFEVINLGRSVPVETFLNTARERGADIIAMSSLLTTSMPYMKDLLATIKATGEKDRFKVLIGGGPVTEEWAAQSGANGYGKDAAEAVAAARKLVGA